MAILRTLFRWLLKRWLVSILGLLCLMLAIWFLGPLVAIEGWAPLTSTQLRLLAILIVVIIWTMMNGGFRLLVRLIGGFGKDTEPDGGGLPSAESDAGRGLATMVLRFGPTLRIMAGVAGMFVVFGWGVSFFHNKNYVTEMDTKVREYEQQAGRLAEGSGSIVELLSPLNALRALPGGYDDRDKSLPWWMGLGLSQRKKLGSAAQLAYRRTLNTVFRPRIVQGLEQQLRSYADRPEILYQALKAYLMIGHRKVFDADFFRFWVTLDWNRRLPGAANARTREGFAKHLSALLVQNLDLPALDSDLVAQAREILSRKPIENRVYADLKQEAVQSGLKEWSASVVIGGAANRYFRRSSGESMSKGVPGFFTYAGFTEFFLQKSQEFIRVAVDESWVLGPEYSKRMGEIDSALLTAAVSDLYFAEYGHVWEAYLADVDIATFENMNEFTEVAKFLSDEDSPIKRLLQAVGEETTLTKITTASEMRNVTGRLAELQARFEKLLNLAPAARGTGLLANPAAAVDRRFKLLHALFDEEKGPAPINEVLSLISDLHAYLETARRASGAAGEGAIDNLRVKSGVQPEPLRRWLAALAEQTTAVTSRNIRELLNVAWSGEVARFCRQAFAKRYPMDANSSRDANLNDFARYFGPQGMIHSFFAKYLSPHVDTEKRPWRARSDNDQILDIPHNTLRHFERADQIREAFFPDGGTQPTVRFQIRPFELDRRARHVLLEIGDQRLVYRHGPPRFLAMRWPPPGGALRAKIEIAPLVPFVGKQKAKSAKGPWSLFRLLDRGKVIAGGQKDRFKISFKLGKLSAAFEIRTSADNPFFLTALRDFRCLERL